MIYNELGQLIEKDLYDSSALVQSVDYRYNIRGWLQGINPVSAGNDPDDLFSQELLYDGSTSVSQHKAQYNGNIAAIRWKYSGMSDWRGYAYFYDSLNRLTQAAYGTFNGWDRTGPETYSVPLVQYDFNGNILRLKRNGYCGPTPCLMDDLDYDYIYNGNQVDQITDNGNKSWGFRDASNMPEYTYDANCNMKWDRNKGITGITYNHLNLPEIIDLENNRRIEYLYDANGVKLRKKYYENGLLTLTTDYSGEFVYSNGSPDFVLTSEGRLKRGSNGAFYPEYFLKDHLGNVRVVLTSAASPTQVTDYYPFGMEIPLFSTSNNQLKYNSKELQTEADLEWYDYGARFYDPQIGRWHVPDPLAERARRWSPYTYCMDNPIRFIDPDGMEMTDFLDKEGNKILHVEDGSNAVFQQTGENRSKEFFEFKGYDKNQGGTNEVNLQSVIDFAQDYTRENYTSNFLGFKTNKQGNQIKNWETFCNQGTFCIAKSVNSALGQIGSGIDMKIFEGTSGALKASDIAKNLSTSSYPSVDLSKAQKVAKQGGFVVGGWSGHALTLNKQGMINNVGAPREKNNIWDPQYGLPKTNKFYVLYPNKQK